MRTLLGVVFALMVLLCVTGCTVAIVDGNSTCVVVLGTQAGPVGAKLLRADEPQPVGDPNGRENAPITMNVPSATLPATVADLAVIRPLYDDFPANDLYYADNAAGAVYGQRPERPAVNSRAE